MHISLCRELPNPLLTYQLYNRFASAVTDYDDEDRLLKVHDVIQQLPPPHYRSLVDKNGGLINLCKQIIGGVSMKFAETRPTKSSFCCIPPTELLMCKRYSKICKKNDLCDFFTL